VHFECRAKTRFSSKANIADSVAEAKNSRTISTCPTWCA